ncbi:MAG TPA: HepT-like ribonuclease domain-containing protein [Actinomycetota bacterium]|nr:HepT-like ribonuclease domain-containing protein [Actinomycetota bacterium]
MWDAVLYNLAVIGEAIKGLSSETLTRAPEVDWRAAARMRDFLVHHYFATDRDVVANTVERDIPPLRAAIERLTQREP